MLSRTKYFLMVGLLIAAVSLSACQNEFDDDVDEGMDFSDEVSGGGESDSEEGFDFSEEEVDIEDEEEMDFSEEEVEEFDEASCANYPVYVPCGTFTADPGSGTMTCPNQTITLEDSAREFITLIPQNGGNELFARAAGSATGTLTLIETADNGNNASYAGPLVNADGITIFYTLKHISDPDGLGYIFGSFKLVVNNPGVGNCTVERDYDGFQQ